MADPKKQALAGFIVGGLGIVAAVGMGVALAVEDGDGVAFSATKAGFIEEPAGEIGPDAFTRPVDTDDEQICDKDKLIDELEQRPEAFQAWAAVLDIPEEDVPDYIQSLEAKVLDEDTMVTNHGLHDGVAYARPSVLEAGTAVLFGPPLEEPPIQEVTTTTRDGIVDTTATTGPPETAGTTVTAGATTTTVEGGTPVTRCKCGNPLLPPYAPSVPGETATTTTTTELTTTTERIDTTVTEGGGTTTTHRETTTTFPPTTVTAPTSTQGPPTSFDDKNGSIL